MKRAMVTGESGCLCMKQLYTYLVWRAAVKPKAAALYSASALDIAMGLGTKEAESTSDPCT